MQSEINNKYSIWGNNFSKRAQAMSDLFHLAYLIGIK